METFKVLFKIYFPWESNYPVQSSSISRRVVKHRGKGKSIIGRKPKDLKKRTQMIIDDDDADSGFLLNLYQVKKRRGQNSLLNLIL